MKKECTVLGFGKFDDKEKNIEMFRIVIGIDSISENYYGTMVTPVYLEYNKKLEEELIFAINNGLVCEYETTDNIMTGKTKVNKIIIEK